MQAALIGLIQSGKSTLLSAVSGKDIPHPGTTAIEEGIVTIPDERVEWLAALHNSKKITHAAIDCFDVPGFDFTSEHGRAAARRYLQQIRTVDLLEDMSSIKDKTSRTALLMPRNDTSLKLLVLILLLNFLLVE